MEFKDDEPTPFEKDGIAGDVTDFDAKIFSTIKDILYDKLSQGGHSYTPPVFEFRASSIAYCKRKILLKKNRFHFLNDEQLKLLPDTEEEEDTPNTFGSSVVGQLIHETFQDALKERLGEAVKIEEEISVEVGARKAKLVGHYDLLLEVEGEQVVIDIKSTTSKRTYLPKQAHLKQLMAYQGMLGGIKGAILYVHRNDFEISYVPQEFDKQVFSAIIRKVSQLARYEAEKELPPAIPDLPDECGTSYWKCDYYPLCFPEDSLDDFEVVED
ncbi:MAG: PD-(D/E)XK nuclease family protein [Candidatus Heimdallarchaeota archaeon]|nr:PD-(D/E)XK nuclease family protein [Candidatus Heimdallarchaeota archaeon]